MYIAEIDPINERKKRELYKLIVANSDVANALKVTRLFLTEVKSMQHPLYLSLQQTIVVTYARPFTQNVPFGALPSKWSRFSAQNFNEMHAQLVESRNQCVAHSDFAVRKVVISPRGQRIPIEPYARMSDVGFQISNKSFPLSSFPIIEALCLDLGSRLHAEVNKRLNELFPGSDMPGGPIDLLPEEGTEPIVLPATLRSHD